MDGVDVELLYKLLMGDLRLSWSGHRFCFVYYLVGRERSAVFGFVVLIALRLLLR